MSVVLESVANNFREVIENLREEAQKWGIDLEAVTEEVDGPLPRPFERTKEDPLYQSSFQLTLDLMKFIQRWRETGAESAESSEAWGDLTWHHTLFSAKLARALSGSRKRREWDPEWGSPDYQVSAGIASESLNKCQRALEALRPMLPAATDELEGFLTRLADLSESVHERFDTPM